MLTRLDINLPFTVHTRNVNIAHKAHSTQAKRLNRKHITLTALLYSRCVYLYSNRALLPVTTENLSPILM